MKAWYQSKTVWFNIVMTVVGASAALAGSFPQWAPWLGGVTVVGNVVLRVWFTSQPVS